jgi:magnesium chelatase subunit H
MEAQWGPLDRYQGLSTTAGRSCLISGLEMGNVFVGVQPLLGVEGDPMRLLFDRWGGWVGLGWLRRLG